jgi:uncharacterized protein (DUF433 family)
MKCMNEWIVADLEHLGGSLRVRGTRISVALILESLAAGMSVAEIVDAHQSLTTESVRGALAELAQHVPMLPSRGELVAFEYIQQLQDSEGV